ncbi:putative DMT superfamily transporter inner membrane protein [Kingella potus]|uniref:Putative DMT superfamily transporter inner membrane protein n=1 Tax=Kingella potus TaxID=265175 RepID=A0A377QZZ8_9NEIS|nr:EamA family transporter [Kingella potus]UOP00935.1 EamA family transporter [Kingella potus]STR00597.1 putative DMT superfamily transporter inner membrane protein [Kingella potus]
MSEIRTRDLLITAVAPLIWGSTYLVTTEFLPPDRPLTTAMIRAVPAGLLLLACSRRLPARGEWGRIFLLGVLNIGLFQAMLFVSAYRLPGGLAGVLNYTQTLMILVLTAVIGKTMPPKAAWFWAAAGVAGIALLALSPQAGTDGWGIAAALTGAASMSLGVYLSKHWHFKLPPAAFAGWQMLFGGLLLIPFALTLETLPDTFTAANIGGYLYLCLFGAVFGYALFFRGVTRLPAAVVSSLGLLSPVCAFVLGLLFLGQGVDAKSLAGFVLAIASIAGVQKAVRTG